MTSQEFVIWLKGFTEGVHDFNITPKQWDLLKERLEEVSDETQIGFPFGTPNTAPSTHPFPTWQHPHYVDPYNPYKITCTPGTTGHVTIANPNIASFDSISSITFSSGSGLGFGTTSTSTTFSSGSGAWHYTNSTDKTLLND